MNQSRAVSVCVGRVRPFPVQAMAVEDDTAHVLSARTDTVREPVDHPIRIMTALHDDEPRQPGGIVVKGRQPFWMLAMVHDFDQQPSFNVSWVSSALDAVLDACEARQVRALGLECLGVRHGTLDVVRFRTLLDERLDTRQLRFLRAIWLIELG